jgi:hypothetical protein
MWIRIQPAWGNPSGFPILYTRFIVSRRGAQSPSTKRIEFESFQMRLLTRAHYPETKATLQDIAACANSQQTQALLKILAQGNQDVAAGRVKPVTDVVARLRAKPRPI